MPRDDDDWIESAIEAAKRLGRITYIDESVRFLSPREDLTIIDVHLPEENS